jgi:hypothetical protein
MYVCICIAKSLGHTTFGVQYYGKYVCMYKYTAKSYTVPTLDTMRILVQLLQNCFDFSLF